MSPRLEAIGLECVRGERMLFRNLNCRVEAGEMLRIDGDNGAGKTSLLKILCGLSRPESGEVRWGGAPIARDRFAYCRELTYLGHRAALKADLTAAENLDAAAALAARAPAIAAANALREMALDDCLRLPCRLLSAGQRQRVALAGLLMRPGGVWILDEPAAALDSSAIARLEQMLAAQTAVGGIVVFTSHQPLALNHARAHSLHRPQCAADTR
ncbi:MAG: cytochrome c biogenesis heme-transporting ATPase CcmA [bacterium]